MKSNLEICLLSLQTASSIGALLAALWIGKVGNDISAAQKDLAVAQNQMAQVQTYGLEPIATVLITTHKDKGPIASESRNFDFTIHNNKSYSIRVYELNFTSIFQEEIDGCEYDKNNSEDVYPIYSYSCPLTENVLAKEAFTPDLDLGELGNLDTAEFVYFDPVKKRKIQAVAYLSDDRDFDS